MTRDRFFTSTSFPGYLPDSDAADEPIDADCLADDLRDEWQLSLDALAARREVAGEPMDDWEYYEWEVAGDYQIQTIIRVLRLGLVDTSVGINAELPDGQVWEAIKCGTTEMERI